ncbi:hypothetical protein P7K49_029088, partial [Saguinus oedipus]
MDGGGAAEGRGEGGRATSSAASPGDQPAGSHRPPARPRDSWERSLRRAPPSRALAGGSAFVKSGPCAASPSAWERGARRPTPSPAPGEPRTPVSASRGELSG